MAEGEGAARGPLRRPIRRNAWRCCGRGRTQGIFSFRLQTTWKYSAEGPPPVPILEEVIPPRRRPLLPSTEQDRLQPGSLRLTGGHCVQVGQCQLLLAETLPLAIYQEKRKELIVRCRYRVVVHGRKSCWKLRAERRDQKLFNRSLQVHTPLEPTYLWHIFIFPSQAT